jgi:transposase
MTDGRIEIITSVERRRRWSLAEKQRLVGLTLEPGASVSAIARDAGLHPGQLYGWRRQLRALRQIDFTPVQVTAQPARSESAGLGAIEIEFAIGARMRIMGAVDKAALTAAIAALAGGRQR